MAPNPATRPTGLSPTVVTRHFAVHPVNPGQRCRRGRWRPRWPRRRRPSHWESPTLPSGMYREGQRRRWREPDLMHRFLESRRGRSRPAHHRGTDVGAPAVGVTSTSAVAQAARERPSATINNLRITFMRCIVLNRCSGSQRPKSIGRSRWPMEATSWWILPVGLRCLWPLGFLDPLPRRQLGIQAGGLKVGWR